MSKKSVSWIFLFSILSPVMLFLLEETNEQTVVEKIVREKQHLPSRESNKKIPKSALKLFQGKSCISCHQISGMWGDTGRPLDDVGDKYDVGTLKKLIRNPQSVNPSSMMPPQSDLSEAELDAIAKFLATLKIGKGGNEK